MKNKQDKSKLGYVGKKPGTIDRNSWFTPAHYIEMVTDVLGQIDLDPFSSKEANEVVKAGSFFSIDNSAFHNEWKAKTLFMNPPYSWPLILTAIDRFLSERKKYKFDAIVLTNNATETGWFQALLHRASAVCFLDHRISFHNVDGKSVSGNTRGQVFFYFGKDKKRFKDIFSKEGIVL